MGEALAVHPKADVFPMLDSDELQALADDIAANGLIEPLVVDSDGVLIDGRNRLAACKLAGVEPDFVTFDGDALAFIVSANIRRRHLSKSQQAVAHALVYVDESGRWSYGTQTEIVTESRIDGSWLRRAGFVVHNAPDLAEQVLSNTLSLHKAYEEAKQRQAITNDRDAQLAALKDRYADLADLVIEGTLSLPGALGEADQRDIEERQDANSVNNILSQSSYIARLGQAVDLADKLTKAKSLGLLTVQKDDIDAAIAALQKVRQHL